MARLRERIVTVATPAKMSAAA
ncbi:MAG: hypothetical protein QOG71_3490, partial [Pyrinomonadaceae bacterium]|nr:hypothetical protein [Pyrinomonadaceae bacterium]